MLHLCTLNAIGYLESTENRNGQIESHKLPTVVVELILKIHGSKCWNLIRCHHRDLVPLWADEVPNFSHSACATGLLEGSI